MAVLTPYRAQLALLRSRIGAALPRKSLQLVEFATVDGFQVRLSLRAHTHHSSQCSIQLCAGQQTVTRQSW